MEKELSPNDKIRFAEGGVTYFVKDIAIKDFNNKIWRSGFVYGLMSGAGIVLALIAFIISMASFM